MPQKVLTASSDTLTIYVIMLQVINNLY
jgi:hypothetical protein